MKRSRRQKMAMAVAVLLALLMIVPLVLNGLSRSYAITQKDINALKQKKTALKAEADRVKGALLELKKQKNNTLATIMAYDEQNDITRQQVEANQEYINELMQQIGEQQEALDEAIAKEKREYEQFRTRVRVMEETGSASYLGILFKSSSFTDLLGRWELINEIMNSDKDMMAALNDTREMLAEKQRESEDSKALYKLEREELDALQIELAEQSTQAELLVRELMNEQADNEEALVEKDKELKKMDAEIVAAEKKLQEELAAKAKASKKKMVGNGVMQWPVSGYSIGSGSGSKFGMRIHPILKTKKMHNGIDIPAPKGTKIGAAYGGTVIVATYSSGYGNYIVVDHGSGITTLYAHQSKYASGIAVGSEVKQGQVIGYVGSTGLSTGPHLHFETRVNGDPQNPLNYVTSP